jgi:hypothetical protein
MAIGLKKELAVSVSNRVGVLADIAGALAEKGINIQAIDGYCLTKAKAEIRLLATNNAAVKKALKDLGYKSIKENEVLAFGLTNRPGALKGMAQKLAASGVDIKYMYGTACSQGCPAVIVFSTSNNKKARSILG